MAKAQENTGTTQQGPTAKDLRDAGYPIPDHVADDERAFAYSADRVITDPESPDAVQLVDVPVQPLDNITPPAKFADGVKAEKSSQQGGDSGTPQTAGASSTS